MPSPASGYPLIMATDGNLSFPLLATMNAAFALGGTAALIVAVGYPSDDPMELVSLRTRDLTPPTPLENLLQRPGLPPARVEEYGGAEPFYRFLTEELRPLITGTYPVHANNQTLYGHSWGGLYRLHVLFKHPNSFRTFIASSPSVWWNKRSVLNDVPAFTEQIQSKQAAPRVLIMVGSKEQDVPHPLPPSMSSVLAQKMPFVPAPLRKLIAGIFIKRILLNYRMVDNAQDLSTLLQQIQGSAKYQVLSHVFDGDDHTTALSSSIGRSLAFVLTPEK
jgi:ferri-bacillibactin esterase